MVTDNWPVDVKYCSRRLTRQIVGQDAAPRSKWLRKVGLNLGAKAAGVSAEVGLREVDRTNIYDVARRAIDVVSDNTGTLANPGHYVRATVDLSWGAIPVHMGWDRAQNVRVACFFADVEVPDVGSIFPGLFGSATNFLGVADEEYSGGWMPSDAEGMYQILADAAEPEDPVVATKFLEWDRDLSLQSRLRSAATIYTTAATQGPDRMDVLFRPYDTARDVDLSFHGLSPGESGRYSLVMLGTPIWVATPEPQAE
ncbi:hypothetical protein GCM10029976_059390 [Kribbella albertanoniae]|uniref:Uncharacterized protein n=1 Tax=Kribbella albertanoniae TaxID=1266829 RepID=A0A4R4QGT8_9ACTN|nr:hypothetical protein [Kribbella albertanoniae]TDC34828.1 hypothetical protein E1261_02680 [Kribbella albertanoniae]